MIKIKRVEGSLFLKLLFIELYWIVISFIICKFA